MSIRTLQSAEFHGCDVSEVECIEPDVDKHVTWEVSCPRCALYDTHLAEDEAFATAEHHDCPEGTS